MRNVNVLHVLGYSLPNISGYTIRSKYLIENEKLHGVNPCVITSPKYPHEDPFQKNTFISGIEYIRTKKINLLQVPYLSELSLINSFRKDVKQTILQKDIDIIHAHSPSLNGLASMNLSSRHGGKIPLIYHVRALWEDAGVESGKMKKFSAKYFLSKQIENFLFNKADYIVTICNGLKNEIVKRGFPEDKIEIIENGVDTKSFYPVKKDLPLLSEIADEGKFIIGFIGSFFKFEGISTIIEAIQHLPNKNNVKILLIGTGEEYDFLRSEVARLKLGNIVHMTGRVPHNQILRYYSLIDVLVYPRTSCRLTELVTPLKPLEAMAMGKVVIGSNVGGIRELVTDKVTGLLFKPGDAKSLAEAITAVHKNQELRATLGKNALDEINRKRRWDTIASRSCALYNKILRR